MCPDLPQLCSNPIESDKFDCHRREDFIGADVSIGSIPLFTLSYSFGTYGRTQVLSSE